MAEIKAVAKKHGFALADLLAQTGTEVASNRGRPALNGSKKVTTTATSKPVKKRAKAKIKFRNPTETWSGRGRQPRWITAYLSNGGKMDELSI